MTGYGYRKDDLDVGLRQDMLPIFGLKMACCICGNLFNGDI